MIVRYHVHPLYPPNISTDFEPHPGAQGSWNPACQLIQRGCVMSTLEKKLDALIAQQDHIQPEDVTLEHIREQRDKNPSYAANVRYDFSTRYGGYVRASARLLTPSQTRDVVRAAYQFLSGFGRKK